MAKRFTCSEKWRDRWFRQLAPFEKLAWLFMVDNCDIAGVIDLDEDLATFQIGWDEFDWRNFIDTNPTHFERLKSGKIFITKFVSFQQKLPLNEANNAHSGIISRLGQYGLSDRFQIIEKTEKSDKVLTRGSGGATQPPCKGKGRGKGKEVPNKLRELIDGWNRLAIDLAGISAIQVSEPWSKTLAAVVKKFGDESKRPEIAEVFEDVPSLLENIRLATWAHGQDWFSLAGLFTKAPSSPGKLKIEIVAAGGYRDGKSRNNTAPTRTTYVDGNAEMAERVELARKAGVSI